MASETPTMSVDMSAEKMTKVEEVGRAGGRVDTGGVSLGVVSAWVCQEYSIPERERPLEELQES